MMSATAFSIDLRVTMSRGLRSFLTASTSTRHDSAALSILSRSGFAIVEEYMSDMPSASKEELIVLAVYMPPHEPLHGQAFSSTPSKSSLLMEPAMKAPTASKAETMERSCPFQWPGLMVPP